MATRLYCILASDCSKAVIFRRGPSKHVRLILWDRKDDSFEPGQWFKGRIYERRCDLSPRGTYLLYFAANHKGEPGTWTAISKPPYLTALALWPKGDTWGGGGFFDSEKKLILNHLPHQMQLQGGFRLKQGFLVHPLGDHSGRGEDSPVWDARLQKSGWVLQSSGSRVEPKWNAKVVWDYSKSPVVYQRTNPKHSSLALRAKILGINERSGGWYVMEHEVVEDSKQILATLPKSDWADWDRNGDLLYSQGGKLFRMKTCKTTKSGIELEKARELADFSAMKFEPMKAPDGYDRW